MKAVFAICCLAGLLGCSQRESETVFAIIDGEPFSSREIREVVAVKARMMELAKSPVGKDAFPQWANAIAAQAIPQLISAKLLEKDLVKRGVQPATEDIEESLRSYNRYCRTSATNLDELAIWFGDVEGKFRELFAQTALFNAYRRIEVPRTVSDEEVGEYLKGLTNSLNLARSIDALAVKRGDAAWKRLESGEDWKLVADECSEDTLISDENADFWQDWIWCDATGFGYENLAAVLPTLKVGGYSKPIEIDEGLVIVKLFAKEDSQYHLGRIIFRMAQPVEMLSVDAARENLAHEKSENYQRDHLQRLRDAAVIEYPLGENFEVNIW